MGNLWLKIKVWTKIVLFSALSFYALLFTYNNWDNRVELWIWFRTKPTRSVLLYMVFAFLTGVIGTILVRTASRTISQIRELRDRARADKADRRMLELEAKASRLQQRRELTAEPRAEHQLAARPKPAVTPKLEAHPAEALPAPRVEARAIPLAEAPAAAPPAKSDNGALK